MQGNATFENLDLAVLGDSPGYRVKRGALRELGLKQVETTYSAYQPVGVSPGSSGRFASGGGKPGLTPIGSLSFTERIFHTCLTGTNQQAARLLIGGDADWK